MYQKYRYVFSIKFNCRGPVPTLNNPLLFYVEAKVPSTQYPKCIVIVVHM